jgi:hypothetical protein
MGKKFFKHIWSGTKIIFSYIRKFIMERANKQYFYSVLDFVFSVTFWW